jgi:hypothetical protein
MRDVAALLPSINFVRVHKSLRMTPAMVAGVTDTAWAIGDLVDAANA